LFSAAFLAAKRAKNAAEEILTFSAMMSVKQVEKNRHILQQTICGIIPQESMKTVFFQKKAVIFLEHPLSQHFLQSRKTPQSCVKAVLRGLIALLLFVCRLIFSLN